MRTTLTIFLVVFSMGILVIVVVPFFLTNVPQAPTPTETRTARSAEHGVFRSDDGGGTWAPKAAIGAGRRSLEKVRVNGLRVDPRDPNTLYLATNGNGLYQSFDRGESWGSVRDESVLLDSRANVLALAVDPGNSAEWYLAVFQQNRGRLLRTTDDGKSFAEVYTVPVERFGIFDVEILPVSGALGIVTGQGGYLETSDRGRTWRVVRWFRDGLTDSVIDPTNPALRYVVSSRGSIFKTADGGRTWVDITPNFRSFSGATRNQRLVTDGTGTLYLGSNYGLLRSPDGGRSFEPMPLIIPPEAFPMLAIAVDPRDRRHLLVSAGLGVYGTFDGGATWTIVPSPGRGRITDIAFDHQNPKTIYAVVQP